MSLSDVKMWPTPTPWEPKPNHWETTMTIALKELIIVVEELQESIAELFALQERN